MEDIFAKAYPKLIKEWDFDNNGNFKLADFSKGSEHKANWKCEKGHIWGAKIKDRVIKGTNCPICSGKVVLAGFNDLATTNPELLKDWDFEKNIILPTEIKRSSHKEIYWKCSLNHSWTTKAYAKKEGKGCPYCTNQKLLTGFNDLATKYPEALKLWDYEKNTELPTEVFGGNKIIRWWKCPKGHSWDAQTNNVTQGKRCPYCENKRILKGYNDLATTHPKIAKEWDYTKNTLKPNEVFGGSQRKAYFICSKGHSWNARISSRVVNDCPVCFNHRRISFSEKAVLFYILKIFKNALANYKEIIDVDIYVKELLLGIEYDGSYFHKDSKKDEAKNNKLRTDEHLIRIREKGCPELKHHERVFIVNRKDNSSKSLNEAIKDAFKIIDDHFNIDIDLKGLNIDVDTDKIAILEMMDKSDLKDSLAVLCPNIAKEWDYEENGNLKPTQFKKSSNQKVNWVCKHGHKWKAYIYVRTKEQGTGCPYCSGLYAIAGENDIKTTHPEIATQWDYEENKGTDIETVKASSNIKYNWVCKYGHKWSAPPNNRKNGRGCSICGGKKVLKGFNDFEFLYPVLATDWFYEKNINILPSEFTKGSGEKVWWKCDFCKNEYQRKIYEKVKNPKCPKCKKSK